MENSKHLNENYLMANKKNITQNYKKSKWTRIFNRVSKWKCIVFNVKVKYNTFIIIV